MGREGIMEWNGVKFDIGKGYYEILKTSMAKKWPIETTAENLDCPL